MAKKFMKQEYIEKIYSGWLAKVIGVIAGAPIEGWTYQKIRSVFGELTGYPKVYRQFAADDDLNGPIFLIRALEDANKNYEIEAQDVGEAFLNYSCYEQGFLWWGGYGKSTEHTAYLNLRAGVKAPLSGSAALNGLGVAEQIGGQIFVDTWGLVTPGNPDLAAHYAGLAASVTHDKNGIYGGRFVAACISYAFVEQDIMKIIRKGLSYIPEDCEYAQVVNAVIDYHEKTPDDWRSCFQFIFENYGYDKYPGNCHIIPNIAVMILGLLYGNGDFSDTLNICNMCGWDTDCNVGNIATIMGVRGGLEVIDYEKWRKPINDILICSGVVGSLNIEDIPAEAVYLARLAADIAGEELPAPWDEIAAKGDLYCHFEYPGSTHGIRVRAERQPNPTAFLRNTDEDAFSGSRCLKASVSEVREGRIFLYKKTYYVPSDFDDSRYDPSLTPVVYPGQTVSGRLKLAKGSNPCSVKAYAHDAATGEFLTAEAGVELNSSEWQEVTFTIPAGRAGLIDEIGFVIENALRTRFPYVEVLLDEMTVTGKADYKIDFSKSHLEVWSPIRKEVSQFTKLKGLYHLENGRLNLSGSDFAEAYTGDRSWTDYTAAYTLKPECGEHHGVNVRVQGALRSYGVGFNGENKFGLYKNENGYRPLTETEFHWEQGQEYTIQVTVKGNEITAAIDGQQMFSFTDEINPYLFGAIGISVQKGSHSSVGEITVTP